MTNTIERLLSLKQVREIIPFSPMQLYRLQKSGEFPRRIKIGKHRIAWRESDIQKWIEAKVKEH
jgi:prophage regulatory protein